MSTINRPFNVLLSKEEAEQLAALGARHHRSKGAVIRYLIRLAHSMTELGVPRCASGTACLVPHLHRAPDANPAGDLRP